MKLKVCNEFFLNQGGKKNLQDYINFAMFCSNFATFKFSTF